MKNVSEIFTTAPQNPETPLRKLVYETLDRLKIPFERVDSDEVVTMEDCAVVDAKLDMKMVKTLFLSNRQQTEFYLFITRGDKPFNAKNFSAELEIPRVSFAPAELMLEKLGVKIGAATFFGVLLESASDVRVIFDADAMREEFIGCSDGVTTGYMKLHTTDVKRILAHAGKTPEIIHI